MACLCFSPEFVCHRPIGASGDGLHARLAHGKLPRLGRCRYNRPLNELPHGLVDDLNAMGQVEANLDLLIAILVKLGTCET